MGILVNVSMFVRYEQKYKHKKNDQKTVAPKKISATKYRFPTKA